VEGNRREVIADMIARVRAGCPLLQGRVAGAADFVLGLRNYNENMRLPAAYIVPRGQDAGANQNLVGLFQVVQKIIAVVVEFDATPDRRGQAPTMAYDEMERCLFGSVLMWRPDVCRSARGFYLVGASFPDLDRARVFYEWQFAIDWQITDDDAVPIWDLDPTYAPLAHVEVDGFHSPGAVAVPGEDPAFVVNLPTGEPPIPPATDGPWPQPPAEDAP
jgi:hypothetical protein